MTSESATPVRNSDQALFHCPGRAAAGPGSKPVCGALDWNHDEHDYPGQPDPIRARALAVIDARLALADAIRKACPGPHSYVDHHDGYTWWCYFCGYTEDGSRVTPTCDGGAQGGFFPTACGRDSVHSAHPLGQPPVVTRPSLSEGGADRG